MFDIIIDKFLDLPSKPGFWTKFGIGVLVFSAATVVVNVHVLFFDDEAMAAYPYGFDVLLGNTLYYAFIVVVVVGMFLLDYATSRPTSASTVVR
ncbi:MAG: hypothetical protein Q8R36_04150 [bacterium]|nr:hypothetical protein [bacterium]